MLKIWKKISEEVLFINNWWEYRKDIFEIPEKKQGEYHYVHSRGSSMVIPITETGEIILVKQYRYLNEKFSIEFPCGGILPGDSYIETAKKELEEETGYTSQNIRMIGEFNPFNGVTNEICQIFVATKLTECKSKPDITEEFEYLRLKIEEIESMIHKKEIWDGMTLAAFTILKLQIKERQ